MRDHPHIAIARRLKRASGHLEAIIEMVENDRPCADIVQQLQSVESAIVGAKKGLIISATASNGPSKRTV